MIKLLISGDFCPIGRIENILNKSNYKILFNDFTKIIDKVDYSIVNLECPITKSNDKIDKTGPNIKTEDVNSLRALKYAGFNLLTLANNHIQDYGGQGVLDTIKYAKQEGFDLVGAGENKNTAAIPFKKVIKGIRVGFINIAENEFCAAGNNLPGANTFDFIDNTNTIKELKGEVDKVVLIYHGGREHFQLPTPEQRKRLRYFIDCGVDAIVAHHTHCFSGYEYYQNKPIVYSLGNFIFDYKSKYQKGLWTEGMSVILSLETDGFKVELIPHLQGRKEDATLKILEGEEKQVFLERVDELSGIIKNDDLFYSCWENYIKNQELNYLPNLYIKNIYLRALFLKGVLPVSFLRSKHNKLLLNLMRCESHHEISKSILEKK